jgi:hypothetical protein
MPEPGMVTSPVNVGLAAGAFPLSWVWIADVTPLKYPSSVLVAVETATFPLPSLSSARFAVRLLEVIDDAPPVITACFPLNWVWIADVTPLKYPSSVLVAADTATFPLPSLNSARFAVKLLVAIDDAPPVIAAWARTSVKYKFVPSVTKVVV